MRSNASKPFQAQLIAAAGFVVPDTLVTNDPEVVREFHAEHGRVIFKSTSGIRSIVRELEGEFESDAVPGPGTANAVPGVRRRAWTCGFMWSAGPSSRPR